MKKHYSRFALLLFSAASFFGCDSSEGLSDPNAALRKIKDMKLDQNLIVSAEKLDQAYKSVGGEEKSPKAVWDAKDRPLYRFTTQEDFDQMSKAQRVISIVKDKTLSVPAVLEGSVASLGTDVLPIEELMYFDEAGRVIIGDELFQISGNTVRITEWSTLKLISETELKPYSIKAITQYAIDHAPPPNKSQLGKTSSDDCNGVPAGDDCRVRTTFSTINGKNLMAIEYHDAYTSWGPRVTSSTELLYYDAAKGEYKRATSTASAGFAPVVATTVTFRKNVLTSSATVYDPSCSIGCTTVVNKYEEADFTSEASVDNDGYTRSSPSGRVHNTRVIKSGHSVNNLFGNLRDLLP